MVKIVHESEVKSTGKYQTASERGDDRTVTTDASGESTGKVAAASESGERTFEQPVENTTPRRKVKDAGPVTVTADGKVVAEGEAEDKAVRSAATKTRSRKSA